MSWLEIAALAVMLVGLCAGAFLVSQRPAFWAGLGVAVFNSLLPHLAKRMTAEQEKAYQACVRRGGEWDPFRKRCR